MLFSLGRTACSGGDLRETLLSSRHPEKETLRRAEDTPGRSLLRSQIIAPLAQLGGCTERMCILAPGATLWQTSPGASADNPPSEGGSSYQHPPALANRFRANYVSDVGYVSLPSCTFTNGVSS